MPNITEYDAGNIGQSPSDRASSAHVQAGRRIAMQYNEAGQAVRDLGHEIGSTIATVGKAYVDYQAHKEISAGGLGASSLLLSKTQEWEATIKPGSGVDGHDPSIQPKFMGGLEQKLQAFRDSFSTEKGREWADHRINTIREHLANKTTGDMSTMAGVTAHNDYMGKINIGVSTLTADPTPDQLKLQFDMWDMDRKAIVAGLPGMKGAQAADFDAKSEREGKTAFVRAAAEAAMRKTGNADSIVKDERFAPYINQQEIDRLRREEEHQRRLVASEARASKLMAKEEAQYKSDDTMVQLRKDMAAGKPWNQEQLNRAVDAGEMTRKDFFYAIDKMEHYGKEETPKRISDENYQPLLDKIRAGEMQGKSEIWATETNKDPSKRINAQASDRLSRIYDEMRSPEGQKWQQKLKEFEDSVKPSIDKSVVGGASHPSGAIKFREFKDELDLRAEQLGPKERWKLIRKGNKEYMATDETLKDYITPMDAQIQRQMKDILGDVKEPERPKGVPADAIWSPTRKTWMIMKDGQRMKWVE